MNARDHSGMSGQPRQETMLPSTTSGRVDERRAGVRHIAWQRREGGGAAALEEPVDGRHLRPVADRADRQVVGEEVLGDAAHVGIGADVLGRATAGDHERAVALDLDLGERDVDGQAAAGLLRVGVIALVEVVHDELDRAARERGHVDLPAGLAQPVQRVHGVEVLGGVAGDHERARHGLLHSSDGPTNAR